MMLKFFNTLKSDPKLDLTCPYSASVSIHYILEQEKAANKFKVFVSLIGLVCVIAISVYKYFCQHRDFPEAVIATAISGLITALALEDSTNNKYRLLESLQSKINQVTDEELKKKCFDALFKIVETQSFPK